MSSGWNLVPIVSVEHHHLISFIKGEKSFCMSDLRDMMVSRIHIVRSWHREQMDRNSMHLQHEAETSRRYNCRHYA